MGEPLVLGVESSCDETGIGLVRGTTLLANAVASSVEEHARFGGVVPEIASRAHLEALVPTVRAALAEAGVERPDAVAATIGPGLSGALLVGSSAAKAYAAAWGAPFYAVKMVPGDLGTKGGITTNADAQALREDGSVIEGLYAAGNCSSPVMGHTYAGPGATIGPSMVFGALAAEHIAARASH